MVEVVVAREYERLRSEFADFCGCEFCHEDVLVYALNRVPPRYVAQVTGEIVSRVAFDSDQRKADVSIALMEGFRRVQAMPRDGHPGSKTK